MRTQDQMMSRKKATRVVSLVSILVGALKFVTIALSLNDMPRTALVDQLEVAALWFITAGAFVGLSRIWGELAERSAPSL